MRIFDDHQHWFLACQSRQLRRQRQDSISTIAPNGIINRSRAVNEVARFSASQDAGGGQNGWLRGFARPIQLPAMQTAKTADAAALALVPPVTDPTPFAPTQAQVTAAKAVVTQKWPAAVA